MHNLHEQTLQEIDDSYMKIIKIILLYGVIISAGNHKHTIYKYTCPIKLFNI